MPDENNPGTQKFRRTQAAHDGVISDMPLCRRNIFRATNRFDSFGSEKRWGQR
jgi:hypothetical protein